MKRAKKQAPKLKMYVIKKYVMAKSAAEAIQREPKHPVDSVWIDDDWSKGQGDRLADAIGFSVPLDDNED